MVSRCILREAIKPTKVLPEPKRLLQKDFAADALLSNWDVIKADNIIVGNTVRFIELTMVGR